MSSAAHAAPAPARSSEPAYGLRELLAYFVRLGSLGFGGPVALAGYMQRNLVDERRWISEKDFQEGLAPGPLAPQRAIYLGWLHHGIAGAIFDLPTLVIAGVTLMLITRVKARYEPLVILCAGLVGFAGSGGAP